MIFYFTATGNSLYAARKLADATGERLVDIGQALRQEKYDYDITGDERLGVVVPTFAGTLPGTAALFIERLKLTGYDSQYVYGVFTCGGSDGFESAALNAALCAKGIGYNGSFTLVMPDNFIVWSNVPPQPRLDMILKSADASLDRITPEVKAKNNGKIDARKPDMPYMPLKDASTAKGTSVLHVDENCTGCGLCAEICPLRCIGMADGIPEWEGRCSMCLACLHRCPACAVQHGNDTQGKRRYINPNVAELF